MKKIIAKTIVTVMIITIVGCFAAPMFAAETPFVTDAYGAPVNIADPDDTLTITPPPTPPPPILPEPPIPPRY